MTARIVNALKVTYTLHPRTDSSSATQLSQRSSELLCQWKFPSIYQNSGIAPNCSGDGETHTAAQAHRNVLPKVYLKMEKMPILEQKDFEIHA